MMHLSALELRLSNERQRLTLATTPAERELRSVWITQIEKEIEREQGFIALPQLSDDELLAELEK